MLVFQAQGVDAGQGRGGAGTVRASGGLGDVGDSLGLGQDAVLDRQAEGVADAFAGVAQVLRNGDAVEGAVLGEVEDEQGRLVEQVEEVGVGGPEASRVLQPGRVEGVSALLVRSRWCPVEGAVGGWVHIAVKSVTACRSPVRSAPRQGAGPEDCQSRMRA
ncbi:hypothetical protein AB0469_01215 [Streptomyces sp. NPDC093801]|uniref:hypothetical protein n=1 Tax=Streptomyces sp. NPDC093801 TaxID=3155203 RepID=UPI00344B72B6